MDQPMCQAKSTRMTGTVRWFDNGRGRGFVGRDNGEPDCFIHQSGICPDDVTVMSEGMRVTFDVVEERRGPSAVNVARL